MESASPVQARDGSSPPGEPLRLLTPEGALVGSPALEPAAVVELYRAMVRARVYDQRCYALQRQGRLPAYYQASGQEATTAVVFALEADDWIFPAYREPGVWLARGLSPVTAMALWKGATTDDGWSVRATRVARIAGTVGTHLPHATGFSYSERVLGENRLSLAIFGDGATSTGDFHAALNFAGVWRTPTIFFCQNNLYAQSTPLAKQTAAASLAVKAQAYGIAGARVDGMDPLAVHAATAAAVERARAGEGPTLIESLTYRFAPHSTYDGRPVYRTGDEEAVWRARDPLIRTRAYLESLGAWDDEAQLAAETAAREEVNVAIAELENAPDPDRGVLVTHVYSDPPAALAAHVRAEAKAVGARVPELPAADVPEEPAPPDEASELTLAEALRSALGDGMARHPEMVVLGEDVAQEGGVFRVTAGLLEAFGEDRVIDAPLSESGIIGAAVGMAMAGLRPVPEIEFGGFLYIALDQIIGHVARMRWRTRGECPMPMVIRIPSGGGHGGFEYHSDSPEALLVHSPGLKVVAPSSPWDAKGLLASALDSEDPIAFMEPIARYHVRGLVPAGEHRIPIGRAAVRAAGTDLTLVTYGMAVDPSVEAAAAAAAHDGISVEVVDLRTLYPWDEETVLQSVARTGRLLVVHEAPRTLGLGAEILARAAEEGLYDLQAPLARVAHVDAPWHPSAALEPLSMIHPRRVRHEIRKVVGA